MSRRYLDGSKLREHREQLGLTVAEAAARMGRTTAFVERAEASGEPIDVTALAVLAAKLGCHVDDLTSAPPKPSIRGTDLAATIAGTTETATGGQHSGFASRIFGTASSDGR